MASTTKVRWGILGTANIARISFIPAVRETASGEIRAVASRSLEKARAYAEELEIPHAYESYEAVLNDPEIDAVYIPLPNTLHAQWIIAAAQAGKHVFCEKPLTMTYQEAKQAVEACKAARVLLVEAFVYRFHRQSRRLRELLDSGVIGDVLHTEARFHYTFQGPPDNIRLRPEVGGGAHLDIGCYTLSWTRFVMGETPLAVAATFVEDEATGVDKTAVATLRFSRGRTANVSAGIRMDGGQHAMIYGTRGQIEVSHPFHPRPRRGGDPGAQVWVEREGRREDHAVPSEHHPFYDAVEEFQRCVLTGAPLSFDTMQDALEQARLMDACRIAAEEDRWVDLGSIDCPGDS